MIPALAADDPPSPSLRRALRLHGAADLAAAVLYGWLGFVVAPGRSPIWNVSLAATVALLVVAGTGLVAGARWGRAAALLAQGALGALALVAIALLVASAAYLRGIWGPLGQGAAAVCLVVAALLVELLGLLPIVQLRFLLRADVRDRFARR
jgi:hypothetical protein